LRDGGIKFNAIVPQLLLHDKWEMVKHFEPEFGIADSWNLCYMTNTLIGNSSTKPLTPAQTLSAGFFNFFFLKAVIYGEIKIEKPVKRHLGLFQLG